MKSKNASKNENLIIYFIAGIIAAVILFIIFSQMNKEDDPAGINKVHIWSPEMDSVFVKNCYEKYKPQVKDDLLKQENMKVFCRCMLGKIKKKYDEQDIEKVKDFEIRQWDFECREQMLNPNNNKLK